MARSILEPCIEILSEFKLWMDPDILRFRLVDEPDLAWALKPTPTPVNIIKYNYLYMYTLYIYMYISFEYTYINWRHVVKSTFLAKISKTSLIKIWYQVCFYQVCFPIFAWPYPENLVFLCCRACLNSEYKPAKKNHSIHNYHKKRMYS